VLQWWARLPLPERRAFYTGAELSTATGIGMATLGPVLRALGWQRDQVRFDGISTPVWVVPGAKSPKRAVGRPPHPPRNQKGTFK